MLDELVFRRPKRTKSVILREFKLCDTDAQVRGGRSFDANTLLIRKRQMRNGCNVIDRYAETRY